MPHAPLRARDVISRGMAMSSGTDNEKEHAQQQQQPQGDGSDSGHSGEGAASALAHMKSQTKQHRRQSGEDDLSANVRK
jgi:hypothetical protein